MSNQCHRPLKGLFLINGASYDQSLYEIHIVCHLWAFQFEKGLFLINGASYDQSLYEIHIVCHLWPFSLNYSI